MTCILYHARLDSEQAPVRVIFVAQNHVRSLDNGHLTHRIKFARPTAMLSVKLRCIAQKRLLAHRRYLTTLGIRCEDPGRIWERRAPLTPRAVQELINDRAAYAGGDELAVEVESCGRRCFTDAEYEQVS